MRGPAYALVIGTVVAGSSCALLELPALLTENTVTVRASTAGVANTRGVAYSTEVTESLLPVMEGMQRLEGPMTEVAGLNPTLIGVAALGDPMLRLAALDLPMHEVAALSPGMRSLASLQPSLIAVAALERPMERVAALQVELAAVADLRESMESLVALREPLEAVAELRAPLASVGELGALLDHPVVLVLLLVAGLGAWAGVTFLAVRLAILSAFRASPSRG